MKDLPYKIVTFIGNVIYRFCNAEKEREVYSTNMMDKVGDHCLKTGQSAVEKEEYVGQCPSP
jgi:hypothetical protein